MIQTKYFEEKNSILEISAIDLRIEGHMPEFYSKKHSPWNGTFLTRGTSSGSIILP
jgi:hypothetical protein